MRDDSDRFLEQFVIVGYSFRLYADARPRRKSMKAVRSPKIFQKSKCEIGQSMMNVTDRGRCDGERPYECLWRLQNNVKRSSSRWSWWDKANWHKPSPRLLRCPERREWLRFAASEVPVCVFGYRMFPQNMLSCFYASPAARLS